ncbi:hypothetical protein R1sor_016243 [Riccia sorocarpa]|uniref:Short-chain dehydrogenase/reductase SDR n=1 Tax=Riccia sorocarpa TaxID=122646 RepID=A0ABD3HIG8_9MARC
MEGEEIRPAQNSSAKFALDRRLGALQRHLNPLGPSLFHSSFREESGYCVGDGRLSANPTNGVITTGAENVASSSTSAEKETVSADKEKGTPTTDKANKDKVILVVGAGDGVGGAIAKRFAKGGKEDQVVKLVEDIEKSIGEIDVLVFNIGANEKRPILETTARLYFKVWEMAAFAGFLSGREVARHMVPRNRGTIFFTGATASVRGASGFAAFAGGKFALRALAQAMARELGPLGIHVVHSVIDAPVNTFWTRGMAKDPEMMIREQRAVEPADVGELYWQLHLQPRRAWTHEVDLRPWKEPW